METNLRGVLGNERIINAISGGAAGLVSSIIVCPMDMVKIRLQNINTGLGTMDVFRDIWKAQGIRGLYRGVYPTAAGYLPTWSIYFSVYEASKKFYIEYGMFV